MSHECAKPDAWEAQGERNQRYERTFDKIEGHLGRQTKLMEEIVRQGEQILSLRRDQEEDRRLIGELFKNDRRQDAILAQKADMVPWYKSIPVFAALASLLVAFLAWVKG